MIKYILPLLLISSPMMATTNYVCDHRVVENDQLIEEGVQDSYIVYDDKYLGFTVGSNPSNEIRKIELNHTEGIFTNKNTFFSKRHKTLSEFNNGKSLLLKNCNEVKL